MNKPMFFFTGVYETVAQAADFEEAQGEAMRAPAEQERVAATV